MPNSAAANLRSQQSNLVGLILRDITDPFYTEVTAGVSEVLEQQGYLLFLTQCGHSPERLQQSIQSLSRQGVAGIIFNPVRAAAAKPLEHLLGSALPLVCAARSYYRDDVDFIGPDNTHAAQQATTYLIEQGHRHIAYVGGRADSSPAPSASAATVPACCNTACPSNRSGYWSASAPSAAPPTPSPSCCTGTPR